MKEKIFAITMITLVITAVVFNTLKIEKEIDTISDSVENIMIHSDSPKSAKEDAAKAYDLFKKKETFIGLTVNHSDLADIEESFSEMIGYLSIEDPDNAEVTRNRLLDALSHLRRLSGLNIDAII